MTPNNTCKNACILQPVFYTEKCYPLITVISHRNITHIQCLHDHVVSSLIQKFSFAVIHMRTIASNKLPFEVRKVQQAGNNLVYVSIPKRFSQLLKIGKGDIVKIQIDSSSDYGNRLMVSKVPIEGAGGL
jgi:hypothetical protein